MSRWWWLHLCMHYLMICYIVILLKGHQTKTWGPVQIYETMFDIAFGEENCHRENTCSLYINTNRIELYLLSFFWTKIKSKTNFWTWLCPQCKGNESRQLWKFRQRKQVVPLGSSGRKQKLLIIRFLFVWWQLAMQMGQWTRGKQNNESELIIFAVVQIIIYILL